MFLLLTLYSLNFSHIRRYTHGWRLKCANLGSNSFFVIYLASPGVVSSIRALASYIRALTKNTQTVASQMKIKIPFTTEWETERGKHFGRLPPSPGPPFVYFALETILKDQIFFRERTSVSFFVAQNATKEKTDFL